MTGRIDHAVEATATPERARIWTFADWVALSSLAAAGAIVRAVNLATPRTFVFDEFYAADACFYVRGPGGGCGTDTEISAVHPPLAKWLIGLGIELFGFDPTGWRVASVVAGTLGIVVLYVLARRLLGSTRAATLAAGLLCIDPLHVVLSRTAMLDVFVVLFTLLSLLCLVVDRDLAARRAVALPDGGWRRWAPRPWLAASGLSAGAAVASKWSSVYLVALVLVLAVAFSSARRTGTTRPWRAALAGEGPAIALALLALPALVYVASHAGRVDGSILALPWDDGAWVNAFVDRQRAMLDHHLGELFVHPYASPAWSWPLLMRPVLFYFRDAGDGRYEEILAVGNPLTWWPALLAILWTAWRGARAIRPAGAETVIVAGFAAAYLPWLVITRDESFLYYFLPALPFAYLALAHLVDRLSVGKARMVVTTLAVVAVTSFLFLRPVLVAQGLDYDAWERRMLFASCGDTTDDGRSRPTTSPGPPPAGWCWV